MHQKILTCLSSPNIYDGNTGHRFIDLLDQIKKYVDLIPNKDWIEIYPKNNYFDFMAKIFACSIKNINLIVSQDTTGNHEEFKIISNDHPKKRNSSLSKKNNQQSYYNNIKIGIKTSGSSGNPKIIIHDLYKMFEHAEIVCSALHFNKNHTWNISLPVYHIAGLSILLRCFIQNSRYRKISKIELQQKTINGYISVVSAQLPDILNNSKINPRDLTLFVGGGKINGNLTRLLLKKGFNIYTSYGMSESGSTFAINKLGIDSFTNAIGKPIGKNKAKIISGCLAIKSNFLFSGEYKDQRIMPPNLLDNWFLTNDRAEIINDEIILKGRADDIIVTGGKNVSLNKVAEILSRMKVSINYHLMPHDHEKWGQSYTIIFENCSEHEKENLIKICDDNLVKEYRPDKVLFIPVQQKFNGIKPSKEELNNLIRGTNSKNVVYLHGLFGDKNEFKFFLDKGKDENHIALDLPSNDTNLNFKEYIDQLHSKIMRISNTPHLVGFSMGGRLAFYLKYFYPDRYKKIILISSQIICRENPDSRKIEDLNRFNNIHNEEDFKKWLTNFFRLKIYGQFIHTTNCKTKIQNIKFENISRYDQFFKTLSVSMQPLISPHNISWGEDITLITGRDDEKYCQLTKDYCLIIKNSSNVVINDCAHAVHLENPEALKKVLKKILS